MDNETISKLIDRIKALEKAIEGFKTQRIGQQSILPGAVKTRHMGEPNNYFLTGLDANKPSGSQVGNGTTYYYAKDTDKLYIFDGSVWKTH